MPLPRTKLASFGQYTAYHGKLDRDDSRVAYVEGPTLDGRIAPLASFWNDGDATAWARERGAAQKDMGEAVSDRTPEVLDQIADAADAATRAGVQGIGDIKAHVARARLLCGCLKCTGRKVIQEGTSVVVAPNSCVAPALVSAFCAPTTVHDPPTTEGEAFDSSDFARTIDAARRSTSSVRQARALAMTPTPAPLKVGNVQRALEVLRSLGESYGHVVSCSRGTSSVRCDARREDGTLAWIIDCTQAEKLSKPERTALLEAPERSRDVRLPDPVFVTDPAAGVELLETAFQDFNIQVKPTDHGTLVSAFDADAARRWEVLVMDKAWLPAHGWVVTEHPPGLCSYVKTRGRRRLVVIGGSDYFTTNFNFDDCDDLSIGHAILHAESLMEEKP